MGLLVGLLLVGRVFVVTGVPRAGSLVAVAVPLCVVPVAPFEGVHGAWEPRGSPCKVDLACRGLWFLIFWPSAL